MDRYRAFLLLFSLMFAAIAVARVFSVPHSTLLAFAVFVGPAILVRRHYDTQQPRPVNRAEAIRMARATNAESLHRSRRLYKFILVALAVCLWTLLCTAVIRLQAYVAMGLLVVGTVPVGSSPRVSPAAC